TRVSFPTSPHPARESPCARTPGKAADMLRQFVKVALVYLLTAVVQRGLGFLLLPFYARCLTPADYGVLSICNTTRLLFRLAVSLALDSGLGILYFRLEPAEFRRLLGAVWLWLTGAPLLLLGVGELIGPGLSATVFPDVPWDPYLRLALWVAYFNL